MSDNRFLAETGAIAHFAGRFFREGLRPRYEVRELLYQCYVVGYQSLPMVGITGFIMGMVHDIKTTDSHNVWCARGGNNADAY